MHAFTSHRDGARRYFANFDLPTHPLCWLRGHRAKAEVIESKYGDPWVLVACRTCGIRHSDPYLTRGRIDPDDASDELLRQVEAAADGSAPRTSRSAALATALPTGSRRARSAT